MTSENPQAGLEARLAVVERTLEMMRERLDREIAILEQEISQAKAEEKTRFETFQVTHVRNHEREHEQEQHAAALALANMDRRLAGMNEFRQQINATEAKYGTKDELAAHSLANDKAISQLVDRLGAVERTAISDRGNALDRQSADTRFRALERLVYMATGAVTVVMLLLQFLRK